MTPADSHEGSTTEAGRAPGLLRGVVAVAGLTFTEARRRRIVAAALVAGCAFVALFALGLHFMARDVRAHAPAARQAVIINVAVIAALYAANFLIVMTSVLLTVDTLAGEIASGVVETLCTKPVSREAVALGKWLGCWLVLALYALGLCAGVLLVARVVGG
ncbi:MAG TPA: ABC transporter permease subunit, partial [Vicinamibacteria bacterium]